ncbi:Rho GTPase activation protein, partial [Rozella allomycis CSF55]
KRFNEEIRLLNLSFLLSQNLSLNKNDLDSIFSILRNCIHHSDLVLKIFSNLFINNLKLFFDLILQFCYSKNQIEKDTFVSTMKNYFKMEKSLLINNHQRLNLISNCIIQNENVLKEIINSCSVDDMDKCSQTILHIFKNNESTLIELLIKWEVELTDSPQTLFRRNSLASKILTLFAKNNCFDYLSNVLSPCFNYLIQSNNEYEIDPSKEPNPTKLNQNKENFGLEFVCHSLGRIVEEKFKDYKKHAIGGFIFLRFISPAITTPDVFGLVELNSINKSTRRGLVLIAKLIQNLANSSLLVQKEEFIKGMNELLEMFKSPFDEFLDSFNEFNKEIKNVTPKIDFENGKEMIILLNENFLKMDPLIVNDLGQELMKKIILLEIIRPWLIDLEKNTIEKLIELTLSMPELEFLFVSKIWVHLGEYTNWVLDYSIKEKKDLNCIIQNTCSISLIIDRLLLNPQDTFAANLFLKYLSNSSIDPSLSRLYLVLILFHDHPSTELILQNSSLTLKESVLDSVVSFLENSNSSLRLSVLDQVAEFRSTRVYTPAILYISFSLKEAFSV